MQSAALKEPSGQLGLPVDPERRLAVASSAPLPRSRISADAFRKLTLRLKVGGSVTEAESLQTVADDPVDAPETSARSAPESGHSPALSDPGFAELEALRDLPTEPEALPQFKLPAFEPIGPSATIANDPPGDGGESAIAVPVAHEDASSGDFPSLAVEAIAESVPEFDDQQVLALDAVAVEHELQSLLPAQEIAESSRPFDAADEVTGQSVIAPETDLIPEPVAEVIDSVTEPEPLPPADEVPVIAAPAEPILTIVADAEPLTDVEPLTEAREVAAGAEGDMQPAGPPALRPSLRKHAAQDEGPHKTVHPHQPPAVSDRIYDAMIKTIADSVYAKPTAAERAAFLRDIAALMEAEGTPLPVSGDGVDKAAPVVIPREQPVSAADEAATPAALQEGAPDAVRDGPPPDVEPPESAAAMAKAAPIKSRTADPFSVPPVSRPEPRADTVAADEEGGELATSLLEMMSGGAATGLPQERALAADTLLRILPRIPVKQLLAVVERVAIMEQPPPLLVAKLIRDPRPEIVAPLLERCVHITDQDLMLAAREADAGKQRMMARRRSISTMLTDQLIALGDPSVILTLIRNPGANFSHDAFYMLAEIATNHHGLLAPLTTRADLPPPVAFELFWFVPPELRRFIFSRFLTDSETLNKILRITLATYGGDSDATGSESRFPPRDVLEEAMRHLAEGRIDDAAQIFAEHGHISPETALRIISDQEGEPLAVILKALGYQRGRFSEVMDGLRTKENPILRPGREIEELQNIFDSLSFNKARILLTYWDWFVRKSGPYAPRN